MEPLWSSMRPRSSLPPVIFALLLVSIFASYAATPQTTKESKKPRWVLSDTAKNKITAKLSTSKPNSLLLFNIEGELKSSLDPISKDDQDAYHSLKDFTVKKNPIDNCKNPVPSPPCVICDDGRVVCTRAEFSRPTGKQTP